MADGILRSALGALTSPKGSVLAGVAALSMVSLLSIAERGPSASGSSASSIAVHAQTAPAASPAKPSSFSSDQIKDLHGIIKDYLMTNPEVLAEVSQALERKQAAEQAAKAEKYLVDNKPKVFAYNGDVVIGNPKGDVTIVEFFDYNCGWCKRALDDIQKLTKADPRVRVVLKEYPIFGGPVSVTAAKAALASVKQNKYWEFHSALMREKQVTEQNLFVVAQRVGLDVAKLKVDMADKRNEAIIQQNIEVGQGLGIEGTPGFVIDSRVNVGYVAADGMQQMLAEIRKTGCKMC
jgi:protein-disulfide isomerase